VLTGVLGTMPLADVIQWVDARGTRALVTVHGDDGDRWLVVQGRMVVRGAAPEARGLLATDASGPGLAALSREYLLDLFLEPEGRFTLDEHAAPPEPGVELELMAQFLVMEGLRLLDEWPRIRETYPTDTARLAATDAEAPELDTVDAAICRIALDAPALGEARLVLGLSRPALLRRVDALRTRGLVEVEGTPHGPDLEGSLVRQARVLLEERQFAEAAHVFRSLLATNPGDHAVRRLLLEAERRHRDSFNERYAPTDVISGAEGFDRTKLRGTDHALLDQLERPRPLAVLLAVSPLRELETLVALERLVSRGVVRVESAE